MEYPHCGERGQSEEYTTLPCYTKPSPNSTQTLLWPLGQPHYQPYPELQCHEFNPPKYQPDHLNHYTSSPSHPYQTYLSETRDHFPTWPNEEWQTQEAHYHQNQTCLDQFQNQPQPQQSFEPMSEEDHYTNSAAGEIEEATAFQLNMQSCRGSEAETVMNMQHSYEEQQSNVDDMIRQVALLTEMLKEVQENRARSELDGKNGEEEIVREAEEEAPANAEKRSEALLEETEATEIESDEEETQTEEGSIVTPLGLKEDVKLNNTPFYLKPEEVHVPNEKVAEFTIVAVEEGIAATTHKSEGHCYEEEGPEPKAERSRRKAARSIYWVQLQPWPEPLEVKKPPSSGVRPKEKKKIQGTYKNHKKKRGAMKE